MNQNEELTKLVDICHTNLKNSKKCLKYLIKDRLLTKECLVKNKIGFFPQNANVLTKYVSEDLLNRLNILNYSKGSDFSDYFYLIFPIYSEYNDPVGISGRTLLDNNDRGFLNIPKYKNSSYKKANILYGLNHAKKYILDSNNVYVLEGYFDQISMSRNNIFNSIAICGTAFSQNHFLKLARYTDRMTFILDSDEAGIKSVQRIYSKYINRGIKLRFLKVPDSYKDVDEYFSNPIKNKHTFAKDFKQIIPETW
jgi:DNA primase